MSWGTVSSAPASSKSDSLLFYQKGGSITRCLPIYSITVYEKPGQRSFPCPVAFAKNGLLAVLFGCHGGQGIPPGKVDAALLVDLCHHHQNLVPGGHHVLHLFHPALVQLGDVDQPLLAGGDLHKCAEVHQPGDDALIDGADLRVVDDGLDDGDGAAGVVDIDGGDKDVAVVLDVDLDVALGANLLDRKSVV